MKKAPYWTCTYIYNVCHVYAHVQVTVMYKSKYRDFYWKVMTPSISGSYYRILICFQMSRHNHAKLLHVIVLDHCMYLVWKRTCTHSNSVCHVYVQGTNVVHTVHVLTLCTQLQAFTDPAVMKTFRRVELCQCSLQSLMMRRGIIIPAVRTKSFSRGGADIYCTYIVHTLYIL